MSARGFTYPHAWSVTDDSWGAAHPRVRIRRSPAWPGPVWRACCTHCDYSDLAKHTLNLDLLIAAADRHAREDHR